MMMRHGFFASLVLVLAVPVLSGCGERELISETDAHVATASEPAAAPETEAAPDIAGVPAGAYRLDAPHGSLVFRVGHMGFSNYTAQFKTFSIDLELDPRAPKFASVTAVIDPASLDLTSAPDGFREDLLGPTWLNAGEHPQMTYRSTAVELTGPATARITGDFTMNGLTRPVTLEATFNGGYAGQTMDPQARVGFSVTGVLKRSDFGIDVGVPTPPSKMGVTDEVSFQIETEMLGPAWEGTAE